MKERLDSKEIGQKKYMYKFYTYSVVCSSMSISDEGNDGILSPWDSCIIHTVEKENDEGGWWWEK